MKTFHCAACGNVLYFENVVCLKCRGPIGFDLETAEFAILDSLAQLPDPRSAVTKDGSPKNLCQNGLSHQVCNWLAARDDAGGFCAACRLNAVIPNLGVAGNCERWAKIEQAKRRLLYTLHYLGLPVEVNGDKGRPPLRFSFLSASETGPPVMTGHSDGLITVNIAEADDDERERRRVNLHEPYRTLLGHFRHEVGHYYWDRLIANSARIEPFRSLFGDERQDYDRALVAYYSGGPPVDWRGRHVTEYASSHPWEDWAETWAHYLHIVDTVDTAASFRVCLDSGQGGRVLRPPPAPSEIGFDEIQESWFPLAEALNEFNRGMGLHDLYPFILSEAAIGKLRFVHDVVKEASHRGEPVANAASA